MHHMEFPVSILVFLDGALKVQLALTVFHHTPVSILVFLDGALKDIATIKSSLKLIVSILVFLDGALKDGFSYSLTSHNQFQSLFFWMAL